MSTDKSNDLTDQRNEEIESEKEEKSVGETDNSAPAADDQIAELERKASEWQDKFIRKVAEFENYKKRTENDHLNLLKYAAEGFIVKLLPVIDDFERSLQHIKDAKEFSTVEEGIKLVYSKLMKTLEEQGVKKIESIGKPFDVHFHEAILQKNDESVPPHTVIDEVQSGFVYKDKVIRHSKVIVSDDSEDTMKEDN